MLSRSGTTNPVTPSLTRPPAAAPTASVAITGKPWLKASFTTSPQGSLKTGVVTEGRTKTQASA